MCSWLCCGSSIGFVQMCMSIVSYSLQGVHVCQYICTYPKIDQVNLWCLLQHNVSCGRNRNHQADKHGLLCVHMYMCNTLVCKHIYTLCIYLHICIQMAPRSESCSDLIAMQRRQTTTCMLHQHTCCSTWWKHRTKNLVTKSYFLLTQVIFIWPNFSHYF